MAFNFLGLPRAAQKAAFAHMDDKPKGGRRLGSGDRHQKMSAKHETAHPVVDGDTFVKQAAPQPTEEDMKAVRRARLTAGGRIAYAQWRRAGETHDNALAQARIDDKKIRDAQQKLRASSTSGASTLHDTKGRTVTISPAEKADVKAAKLRAPQQMLYTQNRFNGVSHERSLELARAAEPTTKRRTISLRTHQQDELRRENVGPLERSIYTSNRAQGMQHDEALSHATGRPLVTGRLPVTGATLTERNTVRNVMNEVSRDFPDDVFRGTSVDVKDEMVALGEYHPHSRTIRVDNHVVALHKTEAGRRAITREQESGFKVPSGIDDRLKSTLTHEFGHHLDYKLRGGDRDEVLGEVGKALGFEPRKPNESAASWVERNRAKVVNQVGSYAATNDAELMAELWTEYAGRGQQARPAARTLGEFVMRKLGK